MAFNLPIVGFNYIDLSQCASLLNRRFYRQGLNWAVAGFTFYTQGTGTIEISKVPDTWVAANAWKKGFAAWQRMNREALEMSDSVRPRYLDFKVYMDYVHFSGAGNSLPADASGNTATAGEWEYSDIVIPNPSDADPAQVSEYSIMWTGANYNGAGLTEPVVSLIEGYAASRGLPDILDPNTPDDADDASGSTPENWISAIQNEGTDQVSEVLEDMITENNQAPYPFENSQIPGAAPGTTFTDTQYPGGANQLPGLQIHDTLSVTGTTVGARTTSYGGNFQGGLIRIDTAIDAGASVGCLIHLVAGSHRGYMCQPMQDV